MTTAARRRFAAHGALVVAVMLGVGAGAGGGCAPGGSNRTGSAGDSAGMAGDSLRHPGTLVLERSRGAPGDSVQGYARYRVEWPDPSRLPGEGPLADSVRRAIDYALAEGQLDSTGHAVLPDSLAARFLAGHKEFRLKFPEGPGEWYIARRIDIETLPFGLTTLRIQDTRYEGGAHGMDAVWFQSFDPATGRRLVLSDLATDADMDSLRAIGERAFREQKDLSAKADLKANGWFVWEGTGFQLSENFGVTRAGLVFHWNPYDIAPYAAGATDITLPWSVVRPYLKTDGPMAAAH